MIDNFDYSVFLNFAFKDKIFLLLSVVIGLVFLLALFFLIFTILLRVANIQKAKHWTILEKEWSPDMLDIIAGDKPKEKLWSQRR